MDEHACSYDRLLELRSPIRFEDKNFPKALQTKPSHPLISARFFAYTSPKRQVRGVVMIVKENLEERACRMAQYIVEHKATVRAAAGTFGVSKSTVHKDLSERLPAFDRALYQQVKAVLDENKAERHIRGGIATRRKYKGI